MVETVNYIYKDMSKYEVLPLFDVLSKRLFEKENFRAFQYKLTSRMPFDVGTDLATRMVYIDGSAVAYGQWNGKLAPVST